MSEEINLNLQNETLELVEKYKFEPIKGYPMLHWKGKRPFTSTQYYPAQLKENHGEEVNGWLNKIFWGDNIQVMSHLLKQFRGKIDLIYIDPPYDSKADYKKKITIKGKSLENDQSSFEEKQYSDIWSNDEFLQFIYERIILIRELLSDKGSIYVHCDWHKSHHFRCIMDEIFGIGDASNGGGPGFKNEIIWYYRRWTAGSRSFQKMHDTILFYSKTTNYKFNQIFIEATEGQKLKHERGYDRNSVMIDGIRKPQLLIYDKEKVDIAINEGKIDLNAYARVVTVKSNQTIAHDVWENDFLNSFNQIEYELDGDILSDLWEINYINSQAKERQNYPTQKPEELLEKIILTGSDPGDIVFDCFMGSGTTQAVSMKLGRKFIGADINLGSIQTTTKRLLNIISEIKQEQNKLDFDNQVNNDLYTGFSVYNVNNYDIFRNPVQAKDLLKQALEIQPLPNNSLFDGEKDGRMVKIMPINRIANRADLNDLIAGFNYKEFERKNDSNPGKPVEHLLLVCMGHEPDLKAHLEKEVHPFKIDVEVVDILRDKSNLEFKRDSEVLIVIENSKLVIKEFYPMNLLQKLSIMKENVEDWKELTESVMVDFNYDGSVFEPKLVDVPGKNDLVKGVYPIPDEAGTIRVKITDLLSESIETEVQYG